MQVPEDAWTKLSPRCFTPVGGVNGSMQYVLELQNNSVAPTFEFEQS